jgi:hypothetical protein
MRTLSRPPLNRRYVAVPKVADIANFVSQEQQLSGMVIANQQPADLGRLKKLGAKEVATTLTALERFMSQCIHPADYIAYLENVDGPGAKRVADLHRLADGIKHWVMREVLYSNQVVRRGRTLKLFLAVAEVS